MKTTHQNQSIPQQSRHIRILLASTGTLLLFVGFILLVMNAMGLLPITNIWLNFIMIISGIIGTMIALFAWLFPFTPFIEELPANSVSQKSGIAQVAKNTLVSLAEEIQNDLNSTLRTGAVVVLTSDREVACYVNVALQLTWAAAPPAMKNYLDGTHKKPVERHRMDQGYACTAIFRDLDPGDYIVWSDKHPPKSIPVFANEVTMLDWR